MGRLNKDKNALRGTHYPGKLLNIATSNLTGNFCISLIYFEVR